ncbi:unnamed protein product [Cochlearia groenlandica]
MEEDGELEFSNMPEFPLRTSSMDSFFEDLLRDTQACTHTHTCNPPGPDNNNTHTHTCLHVHTKILPLHTQDDNNNDNNNGDDDDTFAESLGKKRPLGNKEAVRKYREKKKAKTASLEEEVVRLRAMNSQLLKRLQGQAALEAEVTRLKCLLVDIRGRIEGEIGSFPYQKPAVTTNLPMPMPMPFSYTMPPCNMQCRGDDNNLQCLQDNGGEGCSMNEQRLDGCEFEELQCFGNQEIPLCSNGKCNIAR